MEIDLVSLVQMIFYCRGAEFAFVGEVNLLFVDGAELGFNSGDGFSSLAELDLTLFMEITSICSRTWTWLCRCIGLSSAMVLCLAWSTKITSLPRRS